MPVKVAFAAKLLLVVVWVVPVNVNESLGGAGATSVLQLAAVFQLLSTPPPSQVLVAAWEAGSKAMIRTALRSEDLVFMSIFVLSDGCKFFQVELGLSRFVI
jgi:hypothetical protein